MPSQAFGTSGPETRAVESSDGLRPDEPVGQRLDRPIALAGAFLQSLEIEHADVSALVSDEAGLLQGIGHDRYAGAAHPEHLGDEFLGEREIVAADQVAAAQEPTRETRLDRVDGIAGGGLLRLRQQDLLAPDEGRAKSNALLG